MIQTGRVILWLEISRNGRIKFWNKKPHFPEKDPSCIIPLSKRIKVNYQRYIFRRNKLRSKVATEVSYIWQYLCKMLKISTS